MATCDYCGRVNEPGLGTCVGCAAPLAPKRAGVFGTILSVTVWTAWILWLIGYALAWVTRVPSK